MTGWWHVAKATRVPEMRGPKVGFLFNHEQTHQIAHALPVALALKREAPALDVALISSTAKQSAEIRRLETRFPPHGCRLVEIGAPQGKLSRWLGALAPVDRLAALRAHLDLFAGLDVLVVPEKTSLLLKTRFGLTNLKFVHTRHGAGDRAVGFDKSSALFDLVLLSGQKIADRLQEAGLLRRHAIVGYPKFDTVDLNARPDPFGNGRPTVMYNPHPAPHLSSWYKWGAEVLEFFRRSQRYNLIFAPHVMLFRRKLHIGLDPVRASFTGTVPDALRGLPHVLIDEGSAKSVDMTHTLSADLYLGEASSQIYEFLARPRPCLFLDAHRSRWQGDANFAHWQAGPVLGDIRDLGSALDQAFASHAQYRPVQERLFSYSFDLTEVPSSTRAARAILKFLAEA